LETRIAALAVPALGALLVEPLYNLTDTAIVGHLGRTPLGGLAVAIAILNVVVFGCGFLSMVTAPRVAFLRGRGDNERGARAAGAAYSAAAVVGLGLALAVGLLAGPLASVAGAHGRIRHEAVVYLRVAAVGMPFVLMMLAGVGHLRGLADTKTPFVILLASNLLNVVAELALVYGAGAGIAGSALGTVLAQVLGAGLFVAVSHERSGLAWWRALPDGAELRRLVSAAGVLIVRTLALLAALSGSTAVAARVGAVTLGGHQIALQVWFLVALSLDALAVPAQILVGEALGGSGQAEAERVARTVVRAGIVVGAGLGVVTAAASPVIPVIFTADHGVRHAATAAIAIAGATMPLAAVAFELDGVLLGSGDIRFLRRAMILALVGFVPLAAATLADHRLGIAGIWCGLGCWMGTRAGVLARRWRTGGWIPEPAPADRAPEAGARRGA
jgi:putative MATE family efflux protein